MIQDRGPSLERGLRGATLPDPPAAEGVVGLKVWILELHHPPMSRFVFYSELEVVVPDSAAASHDCAERDPRSIGIYRADYLCQLPVGADHSVVDHRVRKAGLIAAVHANPEATASVIGRS